MLKVGVRWEYMKAAKNTTKNTICLYLWLHIPWKLLSHACLPGSSSILNWASSVAEYGTGSWSACGGWDFWDIMGLLLDIIGLLLNIMLLLLWNMGLLWFCHQCCCGCGCIGWKCPRLEALLCGYSDPGKLKFLPIIIWNIVTSSMWVSVGAECETIVYHDNKF